MAGLLGDDLSDPQSMAVLALAGGLLSPGSFGQGLSRGIQGYQGTLATAQDMQTKKQAFEMQKLQYAAALRNQNLINDAIQSGMGGDQQPAPSAPSQPSIMAGAGALPPSISAPNNPTMGGAAPVAAPSGPRTMFGAPMSQALPDLMFNGGKGIADLAAKYQTPASFRPGGYAMAPNGQMMQFPQVPEGFTSIRGQDGQWHMVPVDGGPAAVATTSTAKAAGPAAFKQTEVIGQDGQKYTVFNNSLPGFPGVGGSPIGPSSAPAAPQGAPPMPRSAGERGMSLAAALTPQEQSNDIDRSNSPAYVAELDKEIANAKTPTMRAILQAERDRVTAAGSAPASGAPAGGVRTGFAPGVTTGADNAQNVMRDSYKAVMAANNSAQTVKARLDSIGQLAQNAILGGDTQWRDYANNLADIAGMSEKATDRKTAGDLIDKATAQIALAIGGNAQGTDALRSLAQAANPNRKMNLPAVKEAVANLSASMEVPQQKAALATQAFNAGDPVKYNNIEQNFDKNADYRVWQIAKETQGMNAAQIAAYFKQKGYTPEQVGTFAKQKAALSGMGAQF